MQRLPPPLDTHCWCNGKTIRRWDCGRATIPFKGRACGLMTLLGPDAPSLQVQVDGLPLQRVQPLGDGSTWDAVVLLCDGLADSTHTLHLEVEAAPPEHGILKRPASSELWTHFVAEARAQGRPPQKLWLLYACAVESDPSQKTIQPKPKPLLPQQKPEQPKLLTFHPEEPDYKEYCDPAYLQNPFAFQAADSISESNPCFHTFNAQPATLDPAPDAPLLKGITEQAFWQCGERSKRRSYMSSMTVANKAQLDKDVSDKQEQLEQITLGLELAAAIVGMIPWGSYAEPGSKGAEEMQKQQIKSKLQLLRDQASEHREIAHVVKSLRMQPFQPLTLDLNDQVVWTSVLESFLRNHEKHDAFIMLNLKALDQAEYAISLAHNFSQCAGADTAVLREAWQRAMQAEEKSSEALLDAWSASITTSERVEVAVKDQGFLDHLVQNVGLGEIAVDGVQCGNGTRRMQELYGRAVSTAVASLHPLAMQLNTFEVLAHYQDMLCSEDIDRNFGSFATSRSCLSFAGSEAL
eukprot:g28801.t1